MKYGALLLLGAMTASAQMEIVGKVVEPGTNLGIYDATVIVSRLESRGPTLTEAHIEVARLTTDTQGAFRFAATDASRYLVQAEKKGFQPSITPRSGLSSQVTVELSAVTPRRDVQLVLGQNGTVTGRLTDAETGDPISMLILFSTYVSQNGSPSAKIGPLAIPDAKGAFTTQLPPGRYVLQIRPRSQPVMKSFDEMDIAATDLGYSAQYFPEAATLAAVLPIQIASRASIDLGVIRLRKVPLYRVRVKTGGACSPEQTIKIEGSPVSNVEVACGGDLLLRGVPPGKYTLYGRIGNAPAEMLAAKQDFEVTDGNLEITLTLARGTDLSGRVFAAEGASKIPVESLKFRLIPRPFASTLIDPRTPSPSAEGKFLFKNTHPGQKQLQVIGLGDQFYVKQIRFNGAPAVGGIFDFAGPGSIEVEINSQPAALTGTVQDGDKPVPGADVVLLHPGDPSFPHHIAADDKGAFRVLGLVPGEYRYFAVSATDRERAEEPSAWQGLVAAAEKAVLNRGAAQTVTVKRKGF